MGTAMAGVMISTAASALLLSRLLFLQLLLLISVAIAACA